MSIVEIEFHSLFKDIDQNLARFSPIACVSLDIEDVKAKFKAMDKRKKTEVSLLKELLVALNRALQDAINHSLVSPRHPEYKEFLQKQERDHVFFLLELLKKPS